MKVYEMIELLQDMDPDGEVLIATQESWPFECSIAGISERRAFAMNEMVAELEYELSDDMAERERQVREFESNPEYGEDWYGRRLEGSDVLICEGRQLRYGSKGAWETAYAYRRSARSESGRLFGGGHLSLNGQPHGLGTGTT